MTCLDEGSNLGVQMTRLALTVTMGLLLAAPQTFTLETVVCRATKSPIIVDGNIDPAWAEAPPVTSFLLWWGEDSPQASTSVRFLHDAEFLYVLFECADPDIFTLYDERDGMLWEADVVELFLWPAEENPSTTSFRWRRMGPFSMRG